jgi:Flp pilus assembly protein TadB
MAHAGGSTNRARLQGRRGREAGLKRGIVAKIWFVAAGVLAAVGAVVWFTAIVAWPAAAICLILGVILVMKGRRQVPGDGMKSP